MSEKLDSIIEKLKTLTLLEVAELVNEIEKVFGIDTKIAATSFIPTNSIPPVSSGASVEKTEEKTAFDVILTDVPADKKIAVLKVVRTITGLGLKESKDIVENVPKILKEGATKEESEKVKKEIEAAGGMVQVK